MEKLISIILRPEFWGLVILSLLLLIWRVAVWKSKIESKIDNLAKTTDLRFAAVDQRFDALEKTTNQRFDALEKTTDHRFAAVNQRFSDITDLISDLRTDIRNLQNIMIYAKSSSPKILTEDGIKLAKTMDAYAIADIYTEQLIKQAKEEDQSPYEIQRMCYTLAYSKVPDDLKGKDIKRYRKLEDLAYKDNIHMIDLMQVLSLILRDRVLEAVGEEVPYDKSKSDKEVPSENPKSDIEGPSAEAPKESLIEE